ncbi:Tissue alpha-L-fucosidase, partial [Cichlidogyrus casuarinus]
WFNPIYLLDKANKFNTQFYSLGKALPELHELVDKYEPELIWADGDIGPIPYWNSTTFLAWLYNDSPVKDQVVVNDRWGDGCSCKHGGYFNCNDRYRPGKLEQHKWENCYTIDRNSWGFRKEASLSDILSSKELIKGLIETVAFGGNYLLNVGITASGMVTPIFEERLRDIGHWLQTNGEAIFATVPFDPIQQDLTTDSVYYTYKNVSKTAYALITEWPQNSILRLEALPFSSKLPNKVELLIGPGTLVPVPLSRNPQNSSQLLVNLQTASFGKLSPPNVQFAWVLKLSLS